MQTDNKSITQYTSRELMLRDSKAEIDNTARKLMKLASGWRKLSTEQAVELAVMSYITGANPFLQEIYHSGDQGIILGVAWYQRKADEALRMELGHQGSVRADYRPASHEDAVFDETIGDIAWTVTITDTATQERRYNKMQELFKLLTDRGMDAKSAWSIAKEEIGPLEQWTASAVVYAAEEFSGTDKQGNKKPEKWDRNERCKKRAFKWALKKRFPNMEMVSQNDDDLVVIDSAARDVVREIVNEVKQPPREESVVVQELGYSAPPPPPPDDVIEGRAVEPQTKELSRPFPPSVVRARIDEAREKAAGKKATEDTGKIVASVLDTTLGDSTSRYILCKWLVGTESTKNMKDPQVLALISWLGVTKFGAMPEDVVIQEINQCYAEALKAKGQLELGV